VQHYLKDVGLDAELKLQEHGAYMSTTMQSKFEGMVRSPFGIAWEPDAPWIVGHLHDPKLAAMLTGQRRTKDLEARQQIIDGIQRYAAEQQDCAYLNSVTVTASWQPYVTNNSPNITFDYGSRTTAQWLDR
jgi:ABC-type transport system substrate-binding protein